MIRQLVAATSSVAALTFLSACNSTGSATPPPFTPSTMTNSPTPAPTEAAEEKAVAAASIAYRQFIAATDVAYASGGINVAELRKYASGVMLKVELNQADWFRGQKWHSIGRQQVIWVKPLTVGKPDAAGQINDLTLQACVDGSKATAVDANGKSVKEPGTPPQVIDEMRMRRIQGAWKADYPQSRKAGKC
jgi:hypothetical protein